MPADDETVFYHGTRADLGTGDMIEPGHLSNYGNGLRLSWVYFSATLDAAIWGAELARGEGRERIYIVTPTGVFEDDPNLTDKKFPGNPTRSFRSRFGLRVTGEVTAWEGHAPDRLRDMRERVARAIERGTAIID